MIINIINKINKIWGFFLLICREVDVAMSNAHDMTNQKCKHSITVTLLVILTFYFLEHIAKHAQKNRNIYLIISVGECYF